MKPPTDSNGDLFLLQALRLKPVCQNGWSSKSSALSIDGYPSCQFTCLNANGNADDMTKNKMNASVGVSDCCILLIVASSNFMTVRILYSKPKKDITVFPGCYTQLCFSCIFQVSFYLCWGCFCFRIPLACGLSWGIYSPAAPVRAEQRMSRNLWSPQISTSSRMDISSRTTVFSLIKHLLPQRFSVFL